MEVCRSHQVATSRARSASAQVIVNAPSGCEQSPGAEYHELPTVAEDTGRPNQSATSSDNVGGSRDLTIP